MHVFELKYLWGCYIGQMLIPWSTVVSLFIMFETGLMKTVKKKKKDKT